MKLLTDVSGLTVGQAQDEELASGVTVVLFDRPAVAGDGEGEGLCRSGDQVTVDFNHPLAGVRLHFAVEILSVRDASAEEVAHGHPHGPGGHHHH